MSMLTHVFFRGALPPIADIQKSIKVLGFPFVLDETIDSLAEFSGFMPMTRGKEETGCEFNFSSEPEDIREMSEFGVDPGYAHMVSMRWGSDYQEAVAGMCFAAALSRILPDSVVYDEAEDRLFNAEEASEFARQELKALE